MTIRPSDVGRALRWGGLAGVAGLLLFRYVEPAPRWDVLGCMGVALLGVLVSWAAAVRQGRAPAETELPESAAPIEPTGFRLRGRWQPDRTQRQQVGVLLVLIAVALLLFGSASHVTPQLADARAGAARIDPVTVKQVLSHSSRAVRGGGMSHTSKLAVVVDRTDAAGTNGAAAEELSGTIKTDSSVGHGDRLWALHNPDEPGRQAQLAENSEELAALRDGIIRPSGTLLGLCGAAAAGGLVLLLRRRFEPLDDSAAAVAEALRNGRAQALAVTLAGTAPEGRRDLGVGLRLSATDGERRLYLSRFVDVERLADALDGRAAWLYWERPGDGEVPRGRPGRGGELLPAVLVVGSGAATRGVRGWMPRKPDWPVAQGRRLAAMAPEAGPEAEPLGTRMLRRPRPRVGAAVWLGLAALTSAAAAAFPLGGGDQLLVQSAVFVAVLCTVVGMRMTTAKWRPSARRQVRREMAGAR
ncbi:hypothetical protein [Streptomyces sp. NPDC002851]